MWTFEGSGGYGCSPRYIAEEILKRNRQGLTDLDIVWLVNDLSKEFPAEIKKVKSSLWTRAYHLSTARFWVANTRTFYGTVKRKGTTYFQRRVTPTQQPDMNAQPQSGVQLLELSDDYSGEVP